MRVTDLVTEKVLPLLLPTPCLGCGRLLPGRRHFIGLCVRCRARLSALGGDRCGGCGRALRGARLPDGYRCGRCRRDPPAYDRLIALWAFLPPLDAVIHGLKFQRLELVGRWLASEMAGRWRVEGLDADLVVWVPLHWLRHLRRGYNQAERIARPLARELGIAAYPALRRTRATPAQTRLARRERADNVRGALAVRRRAPVAGRRLLLVDDVTTTGSTLRAAAGALRAAGALEITAIAAARTPGTESLDAPKPPIW